VTRAFRSDAIVSLQFRPLLTTWTFTVVARADNNRAWRCSWVIACCQHGSADGSLYFCHQPITTGFA
jgi:hypothetical protein